MEKLKVSGNQNFFQQKKKSGLLICYKMEKRHIIELSIMLNKKAEEAIAIQSKNHPEFEKINEEQKSILSKANVAILTKNENIVTDTIALGACEPKDLPDNIEMVQFRSSYSHQYHTNSLLDNYLDIQFDFKRTEIFDFSNPLFPLNPNQSRYYIQGNDSTWVGGVYADLMSFLEQKKSNISLLYLKNSYTIFLMLVFPLLLFLTSKIVKWVAPYLPSYDHTVLMYGFHVYIFFLLLVGFRVLYNYSKWIFPPMELKDDLSKSKFHAFVVSTLFLGVLTSALWDVIKPIFKNILGSS